MINDLFMNLLACPNCKDSLNERLSAGYALSIGLMMLIPITIFALWGLAIYWAGKNGKTEDLERIETT